MITYWPMAVCDDGKTLFTYDCCMDPDDVIRVFEAWGEQYHLDKMWVQQRSDTNKNNNKDFVVRRAYEIVWNEEYKGASMDLKIFTDNIEEEAKTQINTLLSQDAFRDCKVRKQISMYQTFGSKIDLKFSQ